MRRFNESHVRRALWAACFPLYQLNPCLIVSHNACIGTITQFIMTPLHPYRS